MSKKFVAIAVFSVVLSVAMVIPAFAATQPKPEFHAYSDGRVLVRGAKVTSVSSNTLMANLTVGSWTSPSGTILTDNSTEFLYKNGGKSKLSDVKVGDIISFSGKLDTSSFPPKVKADVVRNWSQEKTPVLHVGKIKTAPASSTPTSFTATFKGSDYTVNVATDTAVLNKNWLKIGIGSLKVGDNIRIYGLQTGTTVDASVVRDIDIN